MPKTSRVSRIGIFGGSFDPVHNAHLELALKAKKEFKLDSIVFVPAKTPPHKMHKKLLGPGHRIKMLKLALKHINAFSVDMYELKKHGITYTYRTLEYFKKKYKTAELFFILGSDSLKDFKTWKNYRAIPRLASIITGRRRSAQDFGRDIEAHFIKGVIKNISSTQIRENVKMNKSIRGLVTPQVEKYIEKNKLYR